MTKTTTENILGIKVEITVTEMCQIFGGFLFVADNNYGEPKVQVKGFKTSKAAFANEVAELTQIIGQEAF